MAEVEIGAKVTVDGTEYKLVKVGKECKLEAKDGETIWRHSRTVARLLEEQAQKPRRRREKAIDETLLAEAKTEAAAAQPGSA